MTPEARRFILKCFCRPLTAVEVACLVNRLVLRTDPIVSAADVRRVWNAERETNPVMRGLEDQFGERPVRGFAQCEHTRLAEGLVAA